MSTTPISQVLAGSSTSYTSSTSSASSSSSTNTDFMALMLAQLKNQNPMDPVDDKEMLTQMAQLNSLSELQAISKKIDAVTNASMFSSATNMIGKTATASSDNDTMITGVVSSVQCLNGQYTVTIGDQTVSLDFILQVAQTETESATTD